jgi:hypothetical protein
LELLNSFSYSGASSSSVVDGKRAAEALQSIAEEERSSNDEADGAAEKDKNKKMTLFTSLALY